jgi:hypothetical protein
MMLPENDQNRLLREQALALSTAVNGMSDQLGNVSKGLASLRTYGQRNRTMILVTITSLVIDVAITVALAVVTSNVIDNNQRINASVGTIDCIIKDIAKVQRGRSAFYDTSIAALNRKSGALARDVSAQVTNSSAAERHAAQVRYLADIAAIDKTKIPPLPVFNPRCK